MIEIPHVKRLHARGIDLPRLVILLALILSACTVGGNSTSINSPTRWHLDDVILLDPADAAQPETDLLAVYTRRESPTDFPNLRPRDGSEVLFPLTGPTTLTIRLDLLDISPQSVARYALAIDSLPGGATKINADTQTDLAWDILINVPATGKISAVGPDLLPLKDLKLRVWRDPEIDSITVSFTANAGQIPVYDRLRIQAFSFPSSGERVADRTPPGRVSGHPQDPARYRLVFRNAFPAYTPAQAMRRWDGAHTGPRGGRHGLYNLLRIARNYNIPVAFTDLNHPVSTSALEYALGMELVNQLEESGIVNYLPERSPSSDRDSRAIEFQNVLPWADVQVAPEGLPVDMRRRIANAGEEVVFLGGDLPESAWGIPEYARSAFAYIRAHPWMAPADEVLGNPIVPGETAYQPNPDETDPLTARNGPALAYDQSLFMGPLHPHPDNLTQLRAVYAAELSILQEAVDWGSQPYRDTKCYAQSTGNIPPFCTLASESVFALIDPRNGGLNFLFVRNDSAVHQLVGPGWQFAYGNSDHTAWNLDAGPFADPDAVPAAFSLQSGQFIIETAPGEIKLIQPANKIVYRLLPSGVRIDLTGNGYAKFSIPLALDPWMRFTNDWSKGYTASPRENGFRWEFTGAAAMTISSSADMTLDAFTDTRNLMGASENPNIEYPAGHYLPFPLALIHGTASDSAWIEIALAD